VLGSENQWAHQTAEWLLLQVIWAADQWETLLLRATQLLLPQWTLQQNKVVRLLIALDLEVLIPLAMVMRLVRKKMKLIHLQAWVNL
jgi:hypothetical protein